MPFRLACCWGLLALGGCAESEAPPPRPAAPAPSPAKIAEPPTAARAIDDGRLLWASPTSGDAIDASLAPRSCGALLHLRPAALAASDEGRRVLRGLGPLAESLPDGRAFVSAEVAVFTVAPGASYDAPAIGVAIDPAPSGDAPSMTREFASLLASSDRDRHATLVFTPRFLLGDGGGLLRGALAPLRDLLLAEARDTWAAASISLHVDPAERLYWELRVITSARESETRTAASVARQAAAWGTSIEPVVRGGRWSPYARAVIERAPAMLGVVGRYARRGVDGRQAVVNGYAPPGAPHQLALIGERLVAELAAPVGAVATATPAAKTLSLADRLRRPVSIAFRRETFDTAVTILAETAGVAITIEGRDLQLEGITRNQMLGIDLRGVPAEDALVEVLRRASGDALATGPADPRQRLVYVVDGDRVRVTTRAAAERRGDELPAVFGKDQ